MAPVRVSLDVNGTTYEREVEPRLLLVHFLRDHLGLTGTHVGCDTSNCGACTVHLNGEAVKSCTLLAAQADGAEIKTIEGMGQEGALHPLQEAFWEHHGLQCGYCTPGMIMAAADLLERNPNPTEELLGGVGIAFEEVGRGHDHPGRAVAALEPVVLPERLLQRVERAVPALRHSLDRLDVAAVRLRSQHRAALHRLAVQKHRAGAAVRGVTADVGAGQAKVVAQVVDEQKPRLHFRLARLSIDSDVHPNVFRHPSSSSSESQVGRTLLLRSGARRWRARRGGLRTADCGLWTSRAAT